MKNDNKSTKGFVKKLTKTLIICLCCIFTFGALSYIAPPLKTYAVSTDILPVDDLTDTTWNVPSGWVADAGYGEFNVINTVNSGGTNELFLIGYNGTLRPPGYNAQDNYICFGNVSDPQGIYSSSMDLIINITGGTDVTNPKLIAWLSEYGELQGSAEPEPEIITTQTPTTPVGFVGFYQDIIFPSLNGLGDTSSTNPVGIARLNGETGIVIGTTAYSGLVLWTESGEHTTFYPWYSLQNDIDEQVNVRAGDLILSALTSEGGMVDIAIIKPYNKGTENTYIYINTAYSSAYKQSMTAYDETIYYLGADGGGVADYEYSYVEVDVENRTYTIPTVADEDATNTWALFQRLNSQWQAEINSYNVGVSSEFGENLIIDTLKAPFTILDSFTLFVVNGTAITLAHIFGALIGLSLFFLFLKLFAGG